MDWLAHFFMVLIAVIVGMGIVVGMFFVVELWIGTILDIKNKKLAGFEIPVALFGCLFASAFGLAVFLWVGVGCYSLTVDCW